MKIQRHCGPRTDAGLLAELDSLERDLERIEALIAGVEVAIRLMAEGDWVLETAE